MGFIECSEVFDFNVALQEYAKDVKRRKELAEGHLHPEPTKDYSLKQGETIKVNLKTAPKKKQTSALSSDNSAGLLPPPPNAKRNATPQKDWSGF